MFFELAIAAVVGNGARLLLSQRHDHQIASGGIQDTSTKTACSHLENLHLARCCGRLPKISSASAANPSTKGPRLAAAMPAPAAPLENSFGWNGIIAFGAKPTRSCISFKVTA